MIETARRLDEQGRTATTSATTRTAETTDPAEWAIREDANGPAQSDEDGAAVETDESFNVVVTNEDVELELIDALKGMYFFG